MTAPENEPSTGLEHLLEANAAWARSMETERPGFFAGLAGQQAPQLLWIGCSDSRVPANQIVGLDPGEVFVHRNVANVVAHGDLNLLAVLQYAVDALQVRHVVVCGHYGCGGVRAALDDRPSGMHLAEAWIRHVQDVVRLHRDELDALPDDEQDDARYRRLCELNVVEQVAHVCRTSTVRGAWAAGRQLSVHGWVYGLSDGRLRDLGVTVRGAEEVGPVLAAAAAAG